MVGCRWVSGKAGLLLDNYIPGDLGFDPLGLKQEEPAAFSAMATKEWQCRRLLLLVS